MTTTQVRNETAPARPVTESSTLYLVVGYDGSDSAQAALETATQLLHGSDGELEIVYVAHLSGLVELSAGAVAGMRATFDDVAVELENDVRVRLHDRVPRWQFRRRNGSVTEELIAVAEDLRRQHGQDATVIIVGASSQLGHHIAGSVPVALARRAGFPLLVVPASGWDVHPVGDGADAATDAAEALS